MNRCTLIVLTAILLFAFSLSGCIQDSSGQNDSNTKTADILMLGAPEPDTIKLLESYNDITFDQKTLAEFGSDPSAVIAPYKIVFFDQSNSDDKSISREASEALQEYVKNGGNLIIVLDSGIMWPQDTDRLSWSATLGEIAPVYCASNCPDPSFVRARISPKDTKHPIMKDFEKYPENAAYVELTAFDVNLAGKEIATMQDVYSQKSFPAIVEKSPAPIGNGKVIYINYQPYRTTSGGIDLLKRILNYMKGVRNQ